MASSAAGRPGEGASPDTGCITNFDDVVVRANPLDYYDLKEQIGEGTSGDVFRAVDKKTLEAVALKYSKAGMPSAQVEQQKQEMAIMFDLERHGSHPNLVKPIRVFDFDGQIVLAMQLWSGGDLLDAITAEAGGVEERRAAEVFEQLLMAVSAMHDHRDGVYVHRDIKPENVIVESSDSAAQVLLCDFGTCVRAAPEAGGRVGSRHWTGTRTYCAPEALRRDPETREYTFSPASDVWACGVVLLVMLTGRFPFPRDSEADEIAAICEGRYFALPDSVSAGAKALVRRLLDVRPERRPTASAALRDDWIRRASLGRARQRAAWHIPTVNVAQGGLVGAARRAAPDPAMTGLGRSLTAGGASGVRPGGAGLPCDRLAEARRLFEEASDDDGTLSEAAFASVMTRLEMTGMPLRRVYAAFCPPGETRLSCTAFVSGLARLTEPSEGRLRLVFDMYDADRSGTIGVDGLHGVLSACATDDTTLEAVKRERLAAIFDGMDAASEGQVTYPAFRSAVQRDPVLAKLLLQPNKHFRRYVRAATTTGKPRSPWAVAAMMSRARRFVTRQVVKTVGAPSEGGGDPWTAGAIVLSLVMLLLAVHALVSVARGGSLTDPLW